MIGRSWRWPISKSSVSCAGVTFRTPVPNSGSIASSAMIGIFSRASGRQACLPNKSSVSLVARMKRHRGVGHDRFRPRGRDFKEATRFFHNLVANEIQISFLRLANHFLIGNAVCAAGSQLIIRRPR